MVNHLKKQLFINLFKIFSGTLCMALAVCLVYEPTNMVTGGISGLSILIKETTKPLIPGGFPIWASNFLLNLPVFVMALFAKGKKFTGYTFLANVAFSVYLAVIPAFFIKHDDYLLTAVFGGVLTGIGLGIVFSAGISTGGTDLLGSILHQWHRAVPVTVYLFCLDACIIVSGIFLSGVRVGAYAVIAVFISSRVMDMILSGLKFGKQIWIISGASEEISRRIMAELNRGVTCMDGEGMYLKEKRKVLLCVVGRREIIKVTDLVKEIDPHAFLIVQDAKEVLGEGFGEFEP